MNGWKEVKRKKGNIQEGKAREMKKERSKGMEKGRKERRKKGEEKEGRKEGERGKEEYLNILFNDIPIVRQGVNQR